MTGEERSAPDRPAPGRPAPGRSPSGPSGPWKLTGFVIAVLGIVLVAVTPNPPTTLQHWVQVLGGASLTGFLTTYAGWHELVRGRLKEWGAKRRGAKALRWLKRRRVAVAIGVVLSAALAVGVPPAWGVARGVAIDLGGCAPATQLRMVASPETLLTARRLASSYERWTAEQDHGCPAADVYAYSVGSDRIREQLRRGAAGWSDQTDALRELGPRPDIWLAATSHETSGLDPQVASTTTVALSPVVLAVPEDVARPPSGQQPTAINRVLSELAQRRPGWGDQFRTVTDQGVPVVRADPDTSELGLLATTLLYGQPGPPGADGPASQAPLGPLEVEQRIDRALDQGGFPLTDTAGLLCRYRQAGSRAAVVATEQDVVRFNLGEPLGGACLTQGNPPERLVALYASDTRALDLQFVRPSWSAPTQTQAAEAFGRWLLSDPGRAAVMRTGLRPPGVFAVGPVLDEPGVSPTERGFPDAAVADGDLARTAATYEQAQRRGRVLFAVDTSGSMAAVSPPEGTRSAVAARAVTTALRGMGPGDEFGLWSFPDASDTGHVEVLPPTSGPDSQEAARQALESVRPIGDTPLFRTMIDAAAALGPHDPARVDAVVVLTDGEDTSSGVGPEAVDAAFAASGARLIVVTIGEVRCSDARLGALAAQTGGECLDADLPTLDRTLGAATAELWGGR